MHKTPQVLHGTPQLGLRLHSVETHEVQQGQYAPPHQRSAWELTYVRSGHVECTIGCDTYGCEPGMLLLTPPAVIHAERARTTYASISMQIAAPLTHPWP